MRAWRLPWWRQSNAEARPVGWGGAMVCVSVGASFVERGCTLRRADWRGFEVGMLLSIQRESVRHPRSGAVFDQVDTNHSYYVMA